MSKFLNVISENLIDNGNKKLYTYYEGFDVVDSVTYSEFYRRIRKFAGYLQSVDSSGERALILLPSSIDFLTAFFSCLFTQTIAVPLYVPDDKSKSEAIMQILTDSDAQYIITSKKYYETISTFLGEDILDELFICFVDDFEDREYTEESIKNNQVAYLQYTSGSTSKPKGVMVTYNNIYENCMVMKNHLKLTENDVFSTWLPFYFDMGLIGSIINTIFNGATNYFTCPEGFMKNPISWLNASTVYNGTILIAPNFAYEMCLEIDADKLESIDLSSVRLTINGSELVRYNTMHVLAKKMAKYKLKPISFNPAYGLAENTLVVSAHEPGRGFKHVIVDGEKLRNNIIDFCDKGLDIVSSGKVCNGVLLEIVDIENGIPLGENEIGEIWISGKSVTQGYWNMDLDYTFNNQLPNDENKYFATGDLGFLHNGYLYVVGRKKDVIIIRGKNFYSQDIEEVILKTTENSLKTAAAFSVTTNNSEELIIFAEKSLSSNLSDEELIDMIKSSIASNCKILPQKVVLFEEDQLPRTGSGKLQRKKCQDMYMELTRK